MACSISFKNISLKCGRRFFEADILSIGNTGILKRHLRPITMLFLEELKLLVKLLLLFF